MSEDIQTKIDINQAGVEQLVTIPGINRVLAERIIQERPFARLEDLRRVRGIGSKSLESMRPYLVLADSAGEILQTAASGESELPVDASAPEASADLSRQPAADMPARAEQVTPPEAAAEQPARAAPAAPPPAAPISSPTPAGETYLRRADALWWGAGLGVFTLVLAILFSLGVLNIINDTLSYAPASQVRALDARAAQLSDQIENLNGDLTSLRARLDAMESLSGRVAGLEEESQALREELEAVQAQTKELQSRSEELSRQVVELQKSSAVFQNFLDGLRRLLLSEGTQ
jgi:competence protein ComEA